MNPQEYIESRLNKMRQPLGLLPIENVEKLEAAIFRLLLSKKFRKYSANEQLIEHCKQAISGQIAKSEPINITFLHGAYKLWRLEESPYVDWAELFALMYYTNWVKGICEIYEPGVWFDFFVDDWIVPKLNNVPMSDVTNYLDSYNTLLTFLKPLQPTNLNMTITPVGSQFESKDAFDKLLHENLSALTEATPGGLPKLTDTQRAMIELNVKTTPEQENEPLWREKIWHLHNAYGATKKAPGYHYHPDKILAFTQPLPSGTTISVGTTKSSIMKFWVGTGVLKKKDKSFIETILSSNQSDHLNKEKQNINISGLNGKNFERIFIFSILVKDLG